jgi:hypothetical protein
MRITPSRVFNLLFLALLISAALPLHALGGREPAPAEPAIPLSAPGTAATEAKHITVTGTIRLLGNEPFPELVLTDSDGNDWYLDGDAKEKARPYQHRELTLRGRPEYKEMTLANGMSVGIRRLLRDAVILE